MMFVGIDIGSSSSKVAVLNDSKELVSLAVTNLGTGTDGLETSLKVAYGKAGITQEDVKFTVATGYGRLHCEQADSQITEITCHAKGVAFLNCNARTIIDIGGQDAKVIRLNSSGQVENFVMNEKCAAGTGRFLEVMARVLGCQLDELSTLAEESQKDVSISSVCTVFAESEVISSLASGETRSDVARGAHRAVARRVAGMYNRVNGEAPVIMTGGVALNQDMIRCLSEELKTTVVPAEHPQIAGAIGASVFAYEKYHKLNKSL